MTENAGNNIYDIKEVVFRYPQGEEDVLRGVSLELKAGETLSILGPNGSGKSTLLDLMAGLTKPVSGAILVEGRDISEYSASQRAARIAYVPQNHHPAFTYSVYDFVLMGRAPHLGMIRRPGDEDRMMAEKSIDDIGITHLRDKYYTRISGGERQLALIARALCQDPKVILFDEPTSHLDYGNQYRTLRIIREFSGRGFSSVITTHNPDHALLLGGRVAVLGRDGLIETGPALEMITADRMRSLYDMDMKVCYNEEAARVCCIAPDL